MDDEMRRAIEMEVTRQLAPVFLALREFARKADIGLRTMANAAQGLQEGQVTTAPCPRCGTKTPINRSPDGGLQGHCTKCTHNWAIF